MAGKTDGQRQLMAYFSHSYRSEDNRINLYFWEMLSRHGLYFAIDPPADERRPMDVSYLEWLMAQSACFIAVIPRREDVPSPFCSPYQMFEYCLAVRAGKPRLVFLQSDLDSELLSIEPNETIRFRRRKKDLDAFRAQDKKRAEAFAARVRRLANERPPERRPVGIIMDSLNPVYKDAIEQVQSVVKDELGWSCQLIDPFQVDSDYRLLQKMGACEVLVSEVRSPYIPADLYGLIHGQAFPTLRIAHLGSGESKADASLAMRLAAQPLPKRVAPADQGAWPLVLSGYQVDASMEPVLFWNDPQDLARRVVDRLRRIMQPREELDEDAKARQYFLRLGRLEGRVFVSNYHGQNALAARIIKVLRDEEAIRVFHYTDEDRNASKPNWKDDVRREIERCTQFVALIDEGFNDSEWCKWEMEVAVDRYKRGKLELTTYKIGTDRLPRSLHWIYKHVQELARPSDEDDEKKVAKVVESVVAFFESGRRVSLDAWDRSRLVDLLERQAGWGSNLAGELAAAGLPEDLAAQVQKAAPRSAKSLNWGAVIDTLAGWSSWIAPWKTPLGLFLASATRNAEPADRGEVWKLSRDQALMPDVRHRVERPPVKRELGLSLDYDGPNSAIGTFQGIRDGRLEDWQPAAGWAGKLPLQGFLGLVGEQPDWESWVAKSGKDVLSGKPFEPFQEKYRQAVGPAAKGAGLLGICVASRASALRAPVEWAKFDGLSTPLGLRHPVRRYLLEAPEPRRTLRLLLTEDDPVPVRVLLVGANLENDLPQVAEEIKSIRDLYAGWFEKLGWPLSDLEMIEPGRVTAAQLKHSILHGGYHLLHFAGHGWKGSEEPELTVIDDQAKDRYVALPASVLGDWVRQSDLRLVYLSSCQGAGETSKDSESAIRRFESLAEALVLSGVPEVVGFRWPILDRQSRAFAERFHKAFLDTLDASFAAFQARASFQTSAQIWAASVVLGQYDSPSPP
jgi:hypothetical protein